MTANPVTPLDLQTAEDLAAQDMPPIRMVVGTIIPAGLLLLAGDPKSGKSLLLMCLALSIAEGKPAWGVYPVDAGDVLYMSYEGGIRSFRQRLLNMIGDDPAPARLEVGTKSNLLGAGLEGQIEGWLLKKDAPRLVVIDTYTAVAPETRGVNRLREDYATLAGLAELATQWPDTLFAVVHHTRKSDANDGDVMQKISGSQGMTAVTDGNAVLSRHTAARQCVLNIRPRNAEESEIVLERDLDTLRWHAIGVDERSQLSASRQTILAWMDTHPGGGQPKTMADDLDLSSNSIRQLLPQMVKDRQLTQPKRGWYSLTNETTAA